MHYGYIALGSIVANHKFGVVLRAGPRTWIALVIITVALFSAELGRSRLVAVYSLLPTVLVGIAVVIASILVYSDIEPAHRSPYAVPMLMLVSLIFTFGAHLRLRRSSPE
jgi:SNF family Na+-dependent transporter